MSSTILEAIPSRVLREGRAYREIRRHPIGSRELTRELNAWRTKTLVEVVALDDRNRPVFDELTRSSLRTSLDDGEAATIAYAVGMSSNGLPVIDEKKATRLYRERWPGRPLVDSATLFRVLAHTGRLSKERARRAVYSALRYARMRVSFHMKPWVVELIGAERAAECPSLGRIRGLLR